MKEKEEDLENNIPNIFKRRRIYIIKHDDDDDDDDDDIKFKNKRRKIEFSDKEKEAFKEIYNKYEKIYPKDYNDLSDRFKNRTPYQIKTYFQNHRKEFKEMPSKNEKIKRFSKAKYIINNDYYEYNKLNDYKWNTLKHSPFKNYEDFISFNKKFNDPSFFVTDPYKLYLKNKDNKDYF
jgi:hypothetical protein